MIYLNAQSGMWVGTVLLNNCELIERPSKKHGFCFKLYHPMNQTIWGSRGPRGESWSRKALFSGLPLASLICRTKSEAAGTCALDYAFSLAKNRNTHCLKKRRCIPSDERLAAKGGRHTTFRGRRRSSATLLKTHVVINLSYMTALRP